MKTKLILLTCSLLLTAGVARDVLAQSSTAPQLPEWKTYTIKDSGSAIQYRFYLQCSSSTISISTDHE